MAKEFFRFLRGELNGFYIQNINNVLNDYATDIKSFLQVFKGQQLEEGKIEEKSLYGLGEFAGVFLPRISKAESSSSIRMTESHIEDGFEFSERGLFDTATEQFNFFHCKDDTNNYFIYPDDYEGDINTLATDLVRSSLVGDEDVIGYIASDETDLFDNRGNVKEDKILTEPPTDKAYTEFYGNQFLMLLDDDNDNIAIRLSEEDSGLFVTPIPLFEDDINTLATPVLRSSLVGDEEILGYISSDDVDVIDEYGNVRAEKILASPPTDTAYTEFYGNQFLFLSEAEVSYTRLEPSLYVALFKAMQWIRYNGTSITSLVKITSLICPNGLVKIGDFEVASDNKHINIYYRYDDTVEIDFKQQRLGLLEYIVKIKFAQVSLVEIMMNND